MGCYSGRLAQAPQKKLLPSQLPSKTLLESLEASITTKALLRKHQKGRFFAVYHTFKSKETSEAWWKATALIKLENLGKINPSWQEAGYRIHFFMPEGGENATCSVWETWTEMTRAEFQAFVDSEKGPGKGGVFNNRVIFAMPAAATTPDSFFENGSGDEPKPTTGAFFWIDRTFKSKEASYTWWKTMGQMKPEVLDKINQDWEATGFKNHYFMPDGGMGQTIWIWETRSDMTIEEFQAFIDSEEGPGEGKVFDNEVHKVMLGAVCPSAFFTT